MTQLSPEKKTLRVSWFVWRPLALGIALLACLGVLSGLANIFLLHSPALRLAPLLWEIMLGLALGAMGLSAIVAWRVFLADPIRKWLRLTSILMVAFALGTSALVLLAPWNTPCPASFSDTFHGTYDACWSWVHPAGGSLTALPDGLRMVGAPGGDLYYKDLNAPRLLQSMNATHFTIETSLTFTTVAYGDYQGAGLVLWQDAQNYLRVEYGNFGSATSQGVGFGIMNHGTYQRILDSGGALDSHQTVALRLERNGDSYAAWWRDDDQGPWFAVGAGNAHFQHVQIGLLVAVGPAAKKPPIAVFHRFTIILPSHNE